MRTPRWSARTIAACALLTLGLSGCTTGGVIGLPGSPGPSLTTVTPTPTPTPTSEPEAVIVVASVDADGKAVTTSGYVNGIIEDGGSCAFVLTSGASTVTTTTAGQADRSTTSCGQGSTPIGRLSRGSWNVVLTYTSLSQRTVVSQPVSVEIP
ncbi:hypothetical protein G3T36_14175 [Diaminobutyricibacter tongyongensis]|uniref:Uncharacterized protein n=1 Tax=Leifsonia tongyongensis TaxID=1268043 RepID=A0A6L9Y181_9MICO|nr:hypothetical protein [Diaminobutyricibacter tongyongensis]NEN07008.1 hypothetical protein [Diaminobutyricibacter tongyongensis]